MLKLERHSYKLKNKTEVSTIKVLLHGTILEGFVNNKIINSMGREVQCELERAKT